MPEKEKLVEAQMKFWLQGHGSLEAAPMCHGNCSPDEKLLKLEILPRGCLQETMTRFVHRDPSAKILRGSFCISEEVDVCCFFRYLQESLWRPK